MPVIDHSILDWSEDNVRTILVIQDGTRFISTLKIKVKSYENSNNNIVNKGQQMKTTKDKLSKILHNSVHERSASF